MILLWGLPGDDTLALVRDALIRRKAPLFFLDQRDALETTLELDVGDRITGQLRVGARTLDIPAVTAAYIRPHDSRKIPQVRRAGPGSDEYRHASELEDALLSWSDITPAFVLNRPAAMASNSSKPYQAMLIEAHGFKIPDTLITTVPEDVRAFRSLHGTIIYKSVSGVRSIVSRVGAEHEERLSDVQWCPTQFQERVPGDDYRVHVVGDQVFTSLIATNVDDYRYAKHLKGKTKLKAVEAPREIADRCKRMAHALRLPVAGIDLRKTPDGDWYCFEVNPSPAFSYYQYNCDYPIDEAVADLLVKGRSPTA